MVVRIYDDTSHFYNRALIGHLNLEGIPVLTSGIPE